MQPVKVYMKNFGPYPEQTVDLSKFYNKTALLVGKNEDDEGSNTNMSGKTRFVKALIWCMFGTKAIDDPSTEIIKFGEKECIVSMYFSEDTYITRKLRGQQQTFDYVKNGVVQSESNKDAQEIFLDDINANRPQKILNSIVNSGIYLNTSTTTFISATPTERTIILTNLFNLDKYDEASMEVRRIAKSTEEKIQFLVERSKQDSIDEQIKSNKETIVSCKKQIKDLDIELEMARDKNSKIKKPEELEKRKEELITRAKELKAKNEEIIKAKRIIEDINPTELKSKFLENETLIEKNEKDLKELSEAYTSIRSLIESMNRQTEDLEKQVTNPQKCPECNADLFYDKGLKKFNLEEARETLSDLMRQKKEKKEEERTVRDEKENLTNRIEQAKKQNASLKEKALLYKTYIEKSKEELADISPVKKEFDEVTSAISSIEKPIDLTEMTQKLDSVKREKVLKEKEIEDLEQKKVEIKETKKEITELKKQLVLCELWGGKTKSIKTGLYYEIKSLIFHKILVNLELATNSFLLNNFKVKTKIKIEADSKGIQVYQSKDNENRPVSNFTGGEASRVSICLAMALSKIFGTKLKLLILDEFFALMDTEGIKNTFEFLDTLKGLKFVISNVPLEYDSLTIVKKNGDSYVKQ